MSTKTIHTGNPANQTLNKNQDNLEIDINQSCNWCFDDKDGVFGSPSTLLPNGTYTKPDPNSPYGPYYPVKAGTVHFNAVGTTSTCDPDGDMDTGHTITVSG